MGAAVLPGASAVDTRAPGGYSEGTEERMHGSSKASLGQAPVRLAWLVASLAALSPNGLAAAQIVRVGTAATDTIVVVVQTAPGEPTPSQTPGSWLVDGQPAVAVGRWTYVWQEGLANDGYPLTRRHHMYVQLPSALIEARTYALTTPYGASSLTFGARETLCEAIKVNQVGYNAGSGVRYANLGVFLGDLGTRLLSAPPSYVVVLEATGATVASGQATYWGDDTSGNHASGEHVYRMDLSAAPPGGPYFVAVPGFGRSPSFGIGETWSREISFTAARGLYHQRCGIALEAAHTTHTRGVCHTTVEVTDAEPPGFITLHGPPRPIQGGYHDAGDFDRRFSHTVIPGWMLLLHEAFPGSFRDGELNIPESGNGIPDWLDEALWGVLLWEQLQEDDGGVRAGTETDRHPTYGDVNAASDDLVYRTYRRDGHTTAAAAGLFAHASRLVAPYDSVRAAALLERAERAWAWVAANNPPSAHAAQRMYATLQLYLTTGNASYHQAFAVQANILLANPGWPQQYYPFFFNLNTIGDGMVFSPYFVSYLLTARPTDASIRAGFRGWLEQRAQDVLGTLAGQPYPLGPAGAVGWGSAAAQGRYADPLIYLYRLTWNPQLWSAASQLGDYSMGLNPLGRSYTTGLGSQPPSNPLHLDSYFTTLAGLGPVPGYAIYGPMAEPSSVPYQAVVWQAVYPAWATLPATRRYSDGWSLIPVAETDTWSVIAPNACLYAFLGSADRIFTDGFE